MEFEDSLQFSPQKFCTHFTSVPYVLHVLPKSSPFICLLIKLLSKQSSPLPCYYYSLRPTYLPQRPILQHQQSTVFP